MGSSKKQMKQVQESESDVGSVEEDGFDFEEVSGDEEFDGFDEVSDGGENEEDEGESESGEDEEHGDDGGEESDEDEEEDDEDEEEEEEERPKFASKDDEMEKLDEEYKKLQNAEQNLIKNLKRQKDEDVFKGQAIKNQKTLWDKALHLRCLVQKVFPSSNALPLEPIRSSFCELDEEVSAAYTGLIDSSKNAIDSFAKLHEALVENNPSISETAEEGISQSSLKSSANNTDTDKEWLEICQMQSRVAPFRNKSIDKWQRKADVQSGAAAKKARLVAFNQNISDQVATHMRDPSKMIRGMLRKRGEVRVYGSAAAEQAAATKDEGNDDGDPEHLDDIEFYKLILKEFLETVDAETLNSVIDDSNRASKTKKRKKINVKDRRASKSRKIRYDVHEKIVNFMAPQPMDLPPMASKLFENLFGLKTQKPTSAA